MFFKRKTEIKKQQFLSWNEIIEIMQDKGLQRVDDEVIKVLFSTDKTHRCIIIKSNKGYLSYVFENLIAFDEDELCFLSPDALPAYWVPRGGGLKPIFSDMDSLMRELKSEPEYKLYFDIN